jgi:small GTP-binding protein
MNEPIVIKAKICLIGAFAVGKTSLIERFVHSRFDEKYLTTIGVKISQKLLPPVENPKTGNFVQHHFLVWDIAAMEKFDTVAKNYYRGATGALAVIDLTRIETILILEEICDKFYSVCPKAELIMVGNKSDLFDSSPGTLQQLQKTAATLSTSYLLTSAKTGENVENVFKRLSEKLGRSK